MKAINALFLTLLLLSANAFAKQKIIDPNNLYPQVKMETSMGVIIVELDRVKAPIAVNNFLHYVISAEYNNTVFHRVIADFIVQGGGYDADYIPRKVGEPIFNESGNGLKNEFATIAMARERDPHSSTRQFYFNAGDNTNLDPGRDWGYTVFGSITFGEDVLEKMSAVETDFNEEVSWPDVPVEPIILIKATLMPDDYVHPIPVED
ncbi:peptidylprolyl isomerase [Thalassomonas sp. M1454]|uniref:peptidylprolyl isomerase n=1 Tax=Thalassomonas sp. M1454 TaxID=2594477 RepID=UPI0011813F6A|nr:peptidylprolyl isomerase [Thalassomonas sp. M1454]TRX55790.1 peptidyl-prolyl cis-trans isomerase [Thalassomonas sp. M1454]